MKKFSFLFFFLLIFFISKNETYTQSNDVNYSKLKASFDLFSDFIRNVNQSYPIKIDPELLTYYAIQDAVRKLDPYTVLYNINDYNPQKEIFLEDFYGFGFRTDTLEGKIFIYDLIESTSAEKAGIWSGDEILQLDGNDLAGNLRLFNSIIDTVGTELQMKLYRKCCDSVINVDLHKTKTKNMPVNLSKIPNSDSYLLSFKNFYKDVSNDITRKLNFLDTNEVKSLIIDLRSNPGGLVNEAVKLANLFILDSLPVCKVVAQNDEVIEEYRMSQKPLFPNIKIVILTDSLTASASEIFASILQEYDRAVLIGNNTFGKGLVQTQIPLRNGYELHLTSGKYLTSVGRWIQHFDFAKNFFKDHTDSNKVFHSKGGRILYQKKGIQPDIFLREDELSHISNDILGSGNMFLFLNNYNCLFHSGGFKFKLESIDYNKFLEFLDKNNFYLKTEIYNQYKVFKETEKQYAVAEKNQKEITEIKQIVNENLKTHKDEIQRLLFLFAAQRTLDNNKFIAEYYQYDKLILKALQVLDKNYYQILLIKN